MPFFISLRRSVPMPSEPMFAIDLLRSFDSLTDAAATPRIGSVTAPVMAAPTFCMLLASDSVDCFALLTPRSKSLTSQGRAAHSFVAMVPTSIPLALPAPWQSAAQRPALPFRARTAA